MQFGAGIDFLYLRPRRETLWGRGSRTATVLGGVAGLRKTLSFALEQCSFKSKDHRVKEKSISNYF